MLLRILPEQIEARWDIFRGVLVKSLPEGYDKEYDLVVNALYAILAGDAVMWGYYEGEEEELKCLVLTVEHSDPITRRVSLLIYAIYALRYLGKDAWRDILDTLKVYSKGMGYKDIIAYTLVPEIEKLTIVLGGSLLERKIEFKV